MTIKQNAHRIHHWLAGRQNYSDWLYDWMMTVPTHVRLPIQPKRRSPDSHTVVSLAQPVGSITFPGPRPNTDVTALWTVAGRTEVNNLWIRAYPGLQTLSGPAACNKIMFRPCPYSIQIIDRPSSGGGGGLMASWLQYVYVSDVCVRVRMKLILDLFALGVRMKWNLDTFALCYKYR